jgi:hypothetical protein
MADYAFGSIRPTVLMRFARAFKGRVLLPALSDCEVAMLNRPG